MSTIMIVGASSGIGEALAQQLLEEGHRIISVSRTAPSFAVHLHIPYDVRSAAELPLTEESLDGLVYCPGSILLKPFKLLKSQDFRDELEINLVGAANVIRNCLPALSRSPQSSIVLFSTVAATAGMPYHSSIAASKGAVEGLTRSLAAELAPAIRVNAIAPSLVKTPLSGRLTDSEVKITAASIRHPLKRIGSPADIASMAAFLLSDAASWITGQVLHVDGGLSALR